MKNKYMVTALAFFVGANAFAERFGWFGAMDHPATSGQLGMVTAMILIAIVVMGEAK